MPSAGPTVSIVRRLRVYTEPAGSFAVDHTGTLGDFADVPLTEGMPQLTLTQETHNPLQAKQNVLDYQEEVIGKKSWTLQFTTAFAPTGVAASNSVAATAGSIQTMLKAIMGGESKGTGTTVSTGWATAGGGNLASAAGFAAGGIAGWADTAGTVHFRPVKSKTGATGGSITLKVRFPGTPATGDTIYAGSTYYWTQDPDTSLQFIVEGYELQDRWVLLGGQGTVTPQLGLDGSIQTLQWNISGVKWLEADEAAGSASIHGVALGSATYSNFSPITGQAGRCIVQTNGTLAYTGATVDISAIAFAHGMTYQDIPSPSGTEGVLRKRMVRASGTPPVSGSFTTYFTGYTNWDARDTKLDKLVFYQNGVSAGGVAMIEASTVQFTNVQPADANGIQSETVEFKGRLDGDVSGTASDLTRSPSRIHFG